MNIIIQPIRIFSNIYREIVLGGLWFSIFNFDINQFQFRVKL